MKIIIGFALGITLASAMAQGKRYIAGVPVADIITIQHGPTKVMAHLDADELAAIREACK